MSNFFLESTHDSSKKIARVSAVISASQQEIFALLADPAQHATIDGSGSVKSSRDEHPNRLELGTKFGMEMKVGVPYKITNEVVEFIEGERIAWRHFGGHIWRYMAPTLASPKSSTTPARSHPSSSSWPATQRRTASRWKRLSNGCRSISPLPDRENEIV